MLTLRQLQYLDALARHGNFGRAAEECAVSQPALSMQIRELEHELGAELVARRQGVTVLTEAGAEVARRAGSILSATRDLADCVRAQRPVAQRQLAARGDSNAGTLRAPPAAAGTPPQPPGPVSRSARNPDQDAAERTCSEGRWTCSSWPSRSRRPSSKRSSCSATDSCWPCRPTIPCRNAPGSARATSMRASCCCWKKAIVCAIRR